MSRVFEPGNSYVKTKNCSCHGIGKTTNICNCKLALMRNLNANQS